MQKSKSFPVRNIGPKTPSESPQTINCEKAHWKELAQFETCQSLFSSIAVVAHFGACSSKFSNAKNLGIMVIVVSVLTNLLWSKFLNPNLSITDFNSSRIYRIDIKTGASTEFFMPSTYEVRDLTVEKTASRPTLWIPAYRPASRMVKVQVR